MIFSDLELNLEAVPSGFTLNRAQVGAKEWEDTSLVIAQAHGSLVTLWAREKKSNVYIVSVVYSLVNLGLLRLDLQLGKGVESYPDISGIFPSAVRMQRGIKDLLGLTAIGSKDVRPWLNHGTWPENYFPLRKEFSGKEVRTPPMVTDYPFIEVAGDGVHEIAVGPVHAGIIEPGHFRFSVVGEKILRLEERLGYAHKGVDKAFERFSAREGYRLAGRVSGDSTAAYSWAYCMALESAWKWKLAARALWIRALILERERIGNHLGDLGGIANDAGFAFGLTQFMNLKEQWLRVNKEIFGHRYMMDAIVPGGVAVDIDVHSAGKILQEVDAIEREILKLRSIYEDHSGLQDRFRGAGVVEPELAKHLGLTGLAGRASGIMQDVRVDAPTYPYKDLAVKICGSREGDVSARVSVRFDEVIESLRLIRRILREMPAGDFLSTSRGLQRASEGSGWIEGWRGGIFVGLLLNNEGGIERCHLHDPSWQNWPVLEYAVIGNIVPDFPLINKSFNLTYSGHDR